MELTARAKINLGLDILGRRPDGYHEIRTIMQSVDLGDILQIEKSPVPGIHMTTDSIEVPADPSNLAYRGAGLLMRQFAPEAGIRMHLVKRVPVAAGMAGGSSDAAAAMRGVNEVLKLGLPDSLLMEKAAGLGADIPFCLMGGTALCEGIGERLTPLPPLPPCFIVLCKLPVMISTGWAYGRLDQEVQLAHPDMDGVLAALSQGDLKGLAGKLGNVFEPPAAERFPKIREICSRMKLSGALCALLTGSGPTVFGIFEEEAAAAACQAQLAAWAPDAFVRLVSPCPPDREQ